LTELSSSSIVKKMPFTAGRPITEAKAELFKALAHPARVRVLELLAEGEHTMGELAEQSGLELSHLSQHVTVLRRAGIVDSRRVKNTVVCTLRDRQTAELLAVARRLIGQNLRQGQALLAALDDVDDAVSLADAGRPLT
jgi:DNA-binding transcriptional ArsR family regulator